MHYRGTLYGIDMTDSLFRSEALEHRKDRLFGEVILLQPLSMTILVGVATFICAMILVILFWGSYARKETVRGYLVPDKGIVKTYAPQQGSIAEIHVNDGDHIKVGQALVTLLSERSLQGGSDIDTVLLKELKSSEDHLVQRLRDEEALKHSEALRLHNHIDGARKELVQIAHSLNAQETRLNILTKRLQSSETLLKKKYLSEHDYQKLNEELLVQKQQYQELERAKVAKENILAQAQSELDQLPLRSQGRQNELDNSISEIKQRAAEVAGRRTVEVRSPIEGIVTALQVRAGQWQATNTPLMAIIPVDAKFQVELFVPSRAIGFIEKGQTVRMRLDPFPYQRFGIYEGKVKVISKHALLPNELPVPLEIKEPVYSIVVELDQQYVKAYGKQFPLQAGMSLEADIIQDRQSLFARIFDPILSVKGRL